MELERDFINKLKIDNKGISLIELILTIAISSILLVMIGIMITYGVKSQAAVSGEVKMQMESQILISQIEELLIEGSRFDVYELEPGKVAYVTFYSNSADIMIHEINKSKLYYLDGVSLINATKAQVRLLPYNDEDNLMAENISELTIYNLISGKNIVTISVTMVIEGNERTFIKQVNLRNRIM